MVFELLDQKLQKIIKKRFSEPTLPQILAIPKILEGKNVLIIAPVASGKTEAALLPLLSKLLVEKNPPISILYISPLKSLNRDLLERLMWWSNEAGIEATIRHGDTTQYERKLQLEFPPDLLILTLETLQPILTAKKFKEHLKNVKYVIVDEIHEIVNSKRGVQLTLALERLRELCGNFQLIMLSATVGDPENIAKFFSGNRPVEIIQASFAKQMDIKVINPKPEIKDRKIAEKIFSSPETAARLRTIIELIKNSHSTITFTNTREFAEILASRIKTLDKDLPIGVHHSSLSKEIREKTERELKEEKIKSIIATSSLQLGIDIGSVDLVIQYMSPRQITHLIQRVGRSGHALGKVSRGVIITTDEDDIFESAVIARRAMAGELEKIKFHENSLDVLAHQIVGLSLDYWNLNLERAYEIVKRAYPYRNLNYKTFLGVCEQLQDAGLIFFDTTIRKRRRGFEYYFSQLSTIPSLKQYKVINVVDNSFVGTLDEEFVALHGEIGTTFIVKAEAWRILDIKENKIFVEPVVDIEAAVPAWEGELIPVPYEVAQEVGKLRFFISNLLKKSNESDVIKEIQKNYPLDENSAKKMVNLIKRQIKFGVVPDHEKILVEDYDNLIILHACFGTLVNETLGRFISSLLTARLGHSVGLKTDPYRIIIQLQEKNMEIVKDILLNTDPEYLKNYIELSLAKNELFEWRFIHVAKRFGIIAPDAEYGKIQIRRIIEDYAGSPVYKETLNELETEKLDIEKTREILKRIQNGEIKIIFKNGLSPLGKIGVKHKYAEIIGPERAEKEIFQLFKKRLLNTDVRLVCINCGQWDKIFKVKSLPKDVKCKKCDARLLGIVRPKNYEIIRLIKKKIRGQPLSNEEKKKYEKVSRTADLYLTYKYKAVLCLAAHGVGPESAIRILSKYHRNDEELLKDIFEAEKQYIKTRRYWQI